jgi:hypothetical protein
MKFDSASKSNWIQKVFDYSAK